MASEIPSIPARLLDDLRHILRQARGQVYAAANVAMVDAYWQIGRRIVEEEQGGSARAEYGAQLIPTLARALSDEFGKGLSVANLKNFRRFYLTFPDAGKSYALRTRLSWTHWRIVMRVENPQARDYYMEETTRQQWSFTSSAFASVYGTLVTGTTGSHQRIRPESVLEMKVVIPPPPLIQAFTTVAQPMFDRINRNIEQSRTLATLRDTLLPKLLSWELSVSNSNLNEATVS